MVKSPPFQGGVTGSIPVRGITVYYWSSLGRTIDRWVVRRGFDPRIVGRFRGISLIGKMVASQVIVESSNLSSSTLRRWCNGNMTDSNSVVLGSNPSRRANLNFIMSRWTNG